MFVVYIYFVIALLILAFWSRTWKIWINLFGFWIAIIDCRSIFH